MLDKINLNYKTLSYTIKDFYQYYISNLDKELLDRIDYHLFKSVMLDYFDYIKRDVLENGKIVQFPARFGEISVRKYRGNPKYLQYDYQSSKEVEAPVWHFNEHTDGYRYKFYWNKSKLMIRNCTKYQIVFTRSNKRRLAQILKNNERDYIEI